MKIINITHTCGSLGVSSGGPARSVSQLCNTLYQHGSVIRIVTAVVTNDLMIPLDGGIQLTALEGRGNSFLDRFCASDFGTALHAIHQKTPIQVVHQHGIWLPFTHAVTNYAYKNHVPLVVAPRGMLEPWALNHNKWKKKLAWALYQKRDLACATAFHATAYSEAESIRRLGFKQPIAVIPNGVELPVLGVERRDHFQASTLNPNASEKRTALFLSRIHPKKGLPMLLDAWKKIAPDHWRLVIAGNDDGGHVAALQTRIEALGLVANVDIVGPLYGDDKEQAYLNADLFVLPSYSENFGIVVTEALGYQVPVLTTTGCPWRELESERCGWWVDPTPAGIEQGLQAALNCTDDERRLMGIRGRVLVENKYLWPAIAQNMKWFYQWLLGEAEKPDFVI